jgi:hypothetical protein
LAVTEGEHEHRISLKLCQEDRLVEFERAAVGGIAESSRSERLCRHVEQGDDALVLIGPVR